jgi:hypothetical protein
MGNRIRIAVGVLGVMAGAIGWQVHRTRQDEALEWMVANDARSSTSYGRYVEFAESWNGDSVEALLGPLVTQVTAHAAAARRQAEEQLAIEVSETADAETLCGVAGEHEGDATGARAIAILTRRADAAIASFPSQATAVDASSESVAFVLAALGEAREHPCGDSSSIDTALVIADDAALDAELPGTARSTPRTFLVDPALSESARTTVGGEAAREIVRASGTSSGGAITGTARIVLHAADPIASDVGPIPSLRADLTTELHQGEHTIVVSRTLALPATFTTSFAGSHRIDTGAEDYAWREVYGPMANALFEQARLAVGSELRLP